MDEKKIVIVSDENGIVAFDDVSIKHDTINRAEVSYESILLIAHSITFDSTLSIIFASLNFPSLSLHIGKRTPDSGLISNISVV